MRQYKKYNIHNSEGPEGKGMFEKKIFEEIIAEIILKIKDSLKIYTFKE